MGALTKEEIKKIMKDPNSPEREIYDKMLKGNPLFPDLDKVDKPKKQTKPKKSKVKKGISTDYKGQAGDILFNKVRQNVKKSTGPQKNVSAMTSARMRADNKAKKGPIVSRLYDAEEKMKNKYKTGSKNVKSKVMEKKAGGRIKMAGGGSMPDFSGDGKITKKDVLIGRGVIKKKAGGSIKAKKMNKCRMDGIAIRGKTRAKQRSK